MTRTPDYPVILSRLSDVLRFLLTGAGFPWVDLDVSLLDTGTSVEFAVAGVHHPVRATHCVGMLRAEGLIPTHTESRLTHSSWRTVKVRLTGDYKMCRKMKNQILTGNNKIHIKIDSRIERAGFLYNIYQWWWKLSIDDDKCSLFKTCWKNDWVHATTWKFYK
jgi:hypothetical protein